MTALRLGTRGSRLALAQALLVSERLREVHPDIEIETVTIATAGDRDQSIPFGEGVGWFTSAIQEALQQGEIDFAVHSFKDLPTERPENLTIAAVPLREDARDALVSRSGQPLRRLPRGATVGTSSPRREMQLAAIRPDVYVRPIRGNVDTRVYSVETGEYDAIVVALAGLKRLNMMARASEIFSVYDMLPAPAQGVLAVECRSDDAATLGILRSIDDDLIRRAATAERAFLARLEAGCTFPAAAYAEVFGTTLKLHGMLAPEGRIVRSKMSGPLDTAAGLGRALATELMGLAGMA